MDKVKKVIDAVDPKLIEQELTKDRFVRDTNNGKKEIYIITYHDSPNTMRELARLREISFRDAGGGTGKELDIDKYDTSENPYKQLIVWCPNEKHIVGGYRFIEGYNLGKDENGIPDSATARLFKFSDKFINDYLPYTIELGRSFVQPIYQPTYNIRKGLYSLDNLWDGLGALTIDFPEIKYFFGKITMYPRFNIIARDMILYVLEKHFSDKENLMDPHIQLSMGSDIKELESVFNNDKYEDDYKILMKYVRRYKESIPPLMNAYMNLSPSMKMFGTAINTHFGNVEETGILVTINDIYDIKKDRHISVYKTSEE